MQSSVLGGFLEFDTRFQYTLQLPGGKDSFYRYFMLLRKMGLFHNVASLLRTAHAYHGAEQILWVTPVTGENQVIFTGFEH